jgi:hypothetical protein
VVPIEVEARFCDLDAQGGPRRVRPAAVCRTTGHDGKIRLGLGLLVQRHRQLDLRTIQPGGKMARTASSPALIEDA